jgi:hypothetical protein
VVQQRVVTSGQVSTGSSADAPASDLSQCRHRDHGVFMDALEAKETVLVTFWSKSSNEIKTRCCAPIDFGPWKHCRWNDNRYHMWDFDSEEGPHPLVKGAKQIVSIVRHGIPFNPRMFVKRGETPAWSTPRNW